MDLSRGAKRCIKLLRWYAARFKDVYPLQSTLAKHLGVTTRQVGRYVKELRDAGLTSVTKGGPHSACYQVVAKENVRSMSGQRPVFRSVSITESQELSNQKQQQAVEEYFGSTKIGGVVASHRVITEVAGILRTTRALEDFKLLVRHRFRDVTPRTWGLVVLLARDVAVTRKPPGQASKPLLSREGTGP